jgi:hypothetical protein
MACYRQSRPGDGRSHIVEAGSSPPTAALGRFRGRIAVLFVLVVIFVIIVVVIVEVVEFLVVEFVEFLVVVEVFIVEVVIIVVEILVVEVVIIVVVQVVVVVIVVRIITGVVFIFSTCRHAFEPIIPGAPVGWIDGLDGQAGN